MRMLLLVVLVALSGCVSVHDNHLYHLGQIVIYEPTGEPASVRYKHRGDGYRYTIMFNDVDLMKFVDQRLLGPLDVGVEVHRTR